MKIKKFTLKKKIRKEQGHAVYIKAGEQRELSASALLWPIFIGWLALLSAGGMFISGLRLEVYPLPLVSVSVIAALGCFLYLRFCKSTVLKRAVPGAGLLIMLVLALLFKGMFVDGFALLGNSFKDLLSLYSLKLYMPYAVSGNYAEPAALSFFMAWLTPFLMAMLSYACLGREFISGLVLLAVFLVLCFLLGEGVSLLWGSLFFASLICCILLYFGQNRSTDMAGQLIIIGLIVAIGTLPLWTSFSGDKPGFLQGLSDNMYDIIDDLRYGKDSTNNLPEGKLYEADSLWINDGVALTVTMEEPRSLYLRGYVGSVYTGNSWEALDSAELVAAKESVYALHKDGFYGFSQPESAAVALGMGGADNSVTVNNIKARSKYVYAPYELKAESSGDSLLYLDDSALQTGAFANPRSVSYNIGSNPVKNSNELIKALSGSDADNNNDSVSSYLRDEALYRSYVYDNFTAVLEDTAEVISVHLEELELNDEGRASYVPALQNIMDYLLGEITYNEDCGAFEDEGDFLAAFLEFHGEGYSLHYATAATLMLRWYGIPARYVEGFVLTPEDVAGIPGGEPINVTGKNAHAWTEYYRDGAGWVPLEITPPYIYIMEQPDDLSDVCNENLLQQYNNGGLTELTEDNYEEEKEKKGKKEEEDSFNLFVHSLVFFCELLAFLLMCVAYFWLRRRFIIAEEKLRHRYMTDRQRVSAHFCSIMNLLEYVHGSHGGLGMEQYIEELERNGGHESALLLKVLLPLQRNAAFGNNPVSPTAARSLRKCRAAICGDAVNGLKFRERIKAKYFKNLY